MIGKSCTALVVLASVAACSHAPGEAPHAVRSPDAPALVIQGSALTGDLLEALRHRVQNMTVTYPATGCPRIAFRGRTGGSPGIYVDGTRVGDACVLMQMSSSDVDRVEIYRSGIPTRAGIQSNPNGLILVYRIRR
jgi:hypothetical protein